VSSFSGSDILTVPYYRRSPWNTEVLTLYADL
jgi:hypothetical protein